MKDVLNFRAQNSVRCDNLPAPVVQHGNLTSSAHLYDSSHTIVIPHRPARLPAFDGPGTVLKRIFAELGQSYNPDSSCNCSETAALMDALGPEGCEREFKVLESRLKESASKLTVVESVRIAWLAMRKGYLLELTPSSLLSLAIQRSKDHRSRVSMKWSYGITTVPGRLQSHLPRTLESLKAAGFDDPLLSVDGCADPSAYAGLGLEVTSRAVARGNFANWYLCALECYLRDPHADMYAVFEDDIVMSRGARAYLTRTCKEPAGYYNLYSCPENERRVRSDFTGWFMSNQHGLGALALVFRRDLFKALLTDMNMLVHPTNPERGKKFVDGAIATCMSRHQALEWCHSPSIVEHTGDRSTLNNETYPKTRTFRGEDFDLGSLP